jgi:hypothetical protein
MLGMKYFVALFVLALNVGAASADTITQFDVSGKFSTYYADFATLIGAPVTVDLSGTLAVDVSNGQIAQADLYVDGTPYTTITCQPGCYKYSGYYQVIFDIGGPFPSSEYITFDLYPNVSLIDYPGGIYTNLISILYPTTTAYCGGPNCYGTTTYLLQYYIGTGSLTTGIPEPATLTLFATGLGGIVLFGWRRKRKAAAPSATV